MYLPSRLPDDCIILVDSKQSTMRELNTNKLFHGTIKS